MVKIIEKCSICKRNRSKNTNMEHINCITHKLKALHSQNNSITSSKFGPDDVSIENIHVILIVVIGIFFAVAFARHNRSICVSLFLAVVGVVIIIVLFPQSYLLHLIDSTQLARQNRRSWQSDDIRQYRCK